MYERREIEELRTLFDLALREGDEEARRMVAAEATLGVVANDLRDELGEHFQALSAEASDLRGELNL